LVVATELAAAAEWLLTTEALVATELAVTAELLLAAERLVAAVPAGRDIGTRSAVGILARIRARPAI
jgi:hypothetical protein